MEDTKKCFKCGSEKPLDGFYKHSAMADGHLGKCIECTKSDNRANRRAKAEYYRQYDRARFRESEERRRACTERVAKLRRTRDPRHAAREAVGRAIRSGRLERGPCEVCGSKKVQAHHDDYSKPLDVRWLCSEHHWDLHRSKAS